MPSRKDDTPYIPASDVARCSGRVQVGSDDEYFVSRLHPECELCVRRAPSPKGAYYAVHISPWPGNGPCPDRYAMEDR